MNKLDLILKKQSVSGKLFDLQKIKILSELDAYIDEVRLSKNEAEIKYEQYCNDFGIEGVDVKRTFNKIVDCKEEILNCDETLKVLEEIKADLNQEILEDENTKKK